MSIQLLPGAKIPVRKIVPITPVPHGPAQPHPPSSEPLGFDLGNHPGGICLEPTYGVITGCTPPWAVADLVTGAWHNWTADQTQAVKMSQGDREAVKVGIAQFGIVGTTIPALADLFGGQIVVSYAGGQIKTRPATA